MDEAAYRARLAAHDWYFESSDDHRVWRDGWSKLRELREAQKRLDPTGGIWNSIAPGEFQLFGGQPLPELARKQNG